MSVSLSSPVTGAAQTGLTSPTYTVVADTAPTVNGKQWAVTALGGTQTGGRVHSASDPFTISFFRPASIRTLPAFNTASGKPANVPRNTSVVIVRKGVNIAANQVPEVAIFRLECQIPAGADSYDSVNIRAALSALIGSLDSVSAGFGDTCVNSVI